VARSRRAAPTGEATGAFTWTPTHAQIGDSTFRVRVSDNASLDADQRVAITVDPKLTRLPGLGTDIGVGANGSVWIAGTNPVTGSYGIYRWNRNGWRRFRVPRSVWLPIPAATPG
jgi:hypothetical protein